METNNKKYQIDTVIYRHTSDAESAETAPITFNVYADTEALALKAAEDYVQSNYGEELLDAETTITELK